MHPSSYEEMRWFVGRLPAGPLRIADVGSYDVNGTYKPLFPREGWTYVGLDQQAGPNVDIILEGETGWGNVPADSFDVVVSGQTLEHTRFPWLFVRDLARIAKPGGILCVIAPYQWAYHPYPLDCWRILAEGMRAVMEYNGLKVLEAFMNGHADTVGVALKESPASA